MARIYNIIHIEGSKIYCLENLSTTMSHQT
nr:MAG TPA: hypothetical protein [Caudoviricetes sp.]